MYTSTDVESLCCNTVGSIRSWCACERVTSRSPRLYLQRWWRQTQQVLRDPWHQGGHEMQLQFILVVTMASRVQSSLSSTHEGVIVRRAWLNAVLCTNRPSSSPCPCLPVMQQQRGRETPLPVLQESSSCCALTLSSSAQPSPLYTSPSNLNGRP